MIWDCWKDKKVWRNKEIETNTSRSPPPPHKAKWYKHPHVECLQCFSCVIDCWLLGHSYLFAVSLSVSLMQLFIQPADVMVLSILVVKPTSSPNSHHLHCMQILLYTCLCVLIPKLCEALSLLQPPLSFILIPDFPLQLLLSSDSQVVPFAFKAPLAIPQCHL